MCISIKGSILFVVLVVALTAGLTFYQRHNNERLAKELSKWSQENAIDLNKSKVELKPFKVEYNQNEWNLLRQKLETTRYFKKLDDKYVKKFEYGFDPEYARELVEYWKTKFDWKKQVDVLNKFEQFKFTLNDEINIHFVRLKVNADKNKESIKILLVDGWPGSFYGFYKLLDYVKENVKDLSLDIIVPSIPGYAFSMPLNKPTDIVQTAIYFDALMRHLHGEGVGYFVHGEDWGSPVVSIMGLFYPNRVKGIQVTMAFAMSSDIPILLSYLTSFISPSSFYTEHEIKMNIPSKYSFKNFLSVFVKDFGYYHYQASWPDTLGHSLTDSPVGLLAWILEKYSSWTFDFNTEIIGKRDGGLEKFNRDDLLTIVTIYWMSNAITPSIRYYKATTRSLFSSEWPYSYISSAKLSSDVPASVVYFNRELFITPSRVIQGIYPNLTNYAIVENGGHFASFENPKITADYLIGLIRKVNQ